jgi:hypothetical protein
MEYAFMKLGTVRNKHGGKGWLNDTTDYVITQESLRTKFKVVFGDDCDVMARLMYMKMAGCKDSAEISFAEFAKTFQPF